MFCLVYPRSRSKKETIICDYMYSMRLSKLLGDFFRCSHFVIFRRILQMEGAKFNTHKATHMYTEKTYS